MALGNTTNATVQLYENSTLLGLNIPGLPEAIVEASATQFLVKDSVNGDFAIDSQGSFLFTPPNSTHTYVLTPPMGTSRRKRATGDARPDLNIAISLVDEYGIAFECDLPTPELSCLEINTGESFLEKAFINTGANRFVGACSTPAYNYFEICEQTVGHLYQAIDMLKDLKGVPSLLVTLSEEAEICSSIMLAVTFGILSSSAGSAIPLAPTVFLGGLTACVTTLSLAKKFVIDHIVDTLSIVINSRTICDVATNAQAQNFVGLEVIVDPAVVLRTTYAGINPTDIFSTIGVTYSCSPTTMSPTPTPTTGSSISPVPGSVVQCDSLPFNVEATGVYFDQYVLCIDDAGTSQIDFNQDCENEAQLCTNAFTECQQICVANDDLACVQACSTQYDCNGPYGTCLSAGVAQYNSMNADCSSKYGGKCFIGTEVQCLAALGSICN